MGSSTTVFYHLKWRELLYQLSHCLLFHISTPLAPSGLTSLQQSMVSLPHPHSLVPPICKAGALFFSFTCLITKQQSLLCHDVQNDQYAQKERQSQGAEFKRSKNLRFILFMCQTKLTAANVRNHRVRKSFSCESIVRSDFHQAFLKDDCCKSKCYIHSTHEATLCSNLLCFWHK